MCLYPLAGRAYNAVGGCLYFSYPHADVPAGPARLARPVVVCVVWGRSPLAHLRTHAPTVAAHALAHSLATLSRVRPRVHLLSSRSYFGVLAVSRPPTPCRRLPPRPPHLGLWPRCAPRLILSMRMDRFTADRSERRLKTLKKRNRFDI